MPLLQTESPCSASVSRKVRQRVGRRRHAVDEVNRTLDALNQMYGRPGVGRVFPDELPQSLSAAQQKVFEFVKHATSYVGKPPDVGGPEALLALRVSEGYEALPTCSPLGSYDPESISLPAGGGNPVPLATLWGDDGQQKVKEFSQHELLGADEVRCRLKESGVSRCYQDPKFNSAVIYSTFVQKLHDLNMVEYSLEPPKEQVGIFFVRKKNQKLRLILDCRRSNCHFSTPEPIRLATGEAMARMQLEPGQELFTASADLQNAFYTMEMPEDLRTYFGLRRLRAESLGLTEFGGRAISPDTWIYPRVRVIPMGWSWAMWWCQAISERLCEKSGLLEEERLRDSKPSPGSRFWHVQYVDNLHVFGTDRSEVEERFWKAVQQLRSVGLSVHEIELCDQHSRVLGWDICSDGTLRPGLERLWRVRLAIRELLRRGRCSGQQLERLLGHITFVSLCRRESLSVLGECYTYIRRCYHKVGNIWKSVRSELAKWDGIAPLIFSDLTSLHATTMYAVDASDWGMGVVTTNISGEEAFQLGRYVERWRFRQPGASNPRKLVQLEHEEMAFVETHDFIEDPTTQNFVSANFSAVDREWQVVGRHQWKRKDSMPVYEARATQFAVRHALRSTTNMQKRVIILTDSLTAAVSFDKGRAQSFRLRRVLQQTAALSLGSGLRFRTRWIPSEWNPADSPSRGGWEPSLPVREFWHDPSTAGNSSFMDEATQLASRWKECEEDISSGHQQLWPEQSKDGSGWNYDATDLGHRVVGVPSQKQAAAKVQPKKIQERSRANDDLDEGLSVIQDPQEVRGTMAELSEVVGVDSGFGNLQGSRQHVDQLPRVSVPGGRGSQQGELCVRSSALPLPKCKGLECLTKGAVVHEGVAKVVSAEEPDANTLRGSLPPLHAGFQGGQGRSGVGDSALLPFVPPSKRAFQVEGARRGSAGEEGRGILPQLQFASPSKRGGDSIEDNAVGRDVVHRSSSHEFPGTCISTSPAAGNSGQDLLGFQDHDEGCERLHEPGVGSIGVSSAGQPAYVSPPSWGGILRSSRKAEGDAGHSSSRQVDDSQKPQELRKRRKTSSVVHGTRQEHAKTGHGRQKGRAKHVPTPALLKEGLLRVAVFLEIFCGCGRLGSCIAKECGWPVLLWDISYGPEYDLTVRRRQQLILHWINSGVVKAGHLGTPCNSFSRARDRPGGPPRLRSDSQPMGLEGLRPHDERKVQLGNKLMFFTCAVLRLALHWWIPFTLENPQRSRLWIVPPVMRLLKRKFTAVVDVHFCCFGTRWKKPTKIFGVHIPLDSMMNCICRGTKRGLCDFSGCKHIPLMGQTPDGMWYTKLAEAYPLKFARKLAKCFLNSELSLVAADFQRHLQ
eukprot:Skav221970  [mRNA]  locus=scaffold195:898936:903000:- [translate_table: standard]